MVTKKLYSQSLCSLNLSNLQDDKYVMYYLPPKEAITYPRLLPELFAFFRTFTLSTTNKNETKI